MVSVESNLSGSSGQSTLHIIQDYSCNETAQSSDSKKVEILSQTLVAPMEVESSSTEDILSSTPHSSSDISPTINIQQSSYNDDIKDSIEESPPTTTHPSTTSIDSNDASNATPPPPESFDTLHQIPHRSLVLTQTNQEQEYHDMEQSLYPQAHYHPSECLEDQIQPESIPTMTGNEEQKVPVPRLLLFAFLPLIFSAAFNFMRAVLNPVQVMNLVGGGSKTTALAIVGGLTMTTAMITGPIAGHFSDHFKSPYGSRFPIMMVASVLFGLTFLVRIFVTEEFNVFEFRPNGMLSLATVVYMFGEVVSQTVWSCYYGLFKDMFPVSQIGLLSGLNSFMTTLSTCLGVAVFGFLYDSVVPGYIVLLFFAVGVMITGVLYMVLFREPIAHYSDHFSFDMGLFSQFRRHMVEYSPEEEYTNLGANVQNMEMESVPKQTYMQHTIESNDQFSVVSSSIPTEDPQLLYPVMLSTNQNAGDSTTSNTFPNDPIMILPQNPDIQDNRVDGLEEKWAAVKLCLAQALRFLAEFFQPFKNWNFVWLCISRATFALGIGLVQVFGLFYFQDKIGPNGYRLFNNLELIKSAEQAQAIFVSITVVNALTSAVIGGFLSDRIGRRPIISLSCVLMFIGCMGMAFSNEYGSVVAFGVPVGAGLGSFYGSNLALANDIIDKKESATGLALFHLSHNLAIMLSSPVGGLLLKIGQSLNEKKFVTTPNFGYNIMCLFCALLCLSSGALAWLIRGVEEPPITLLTKKIEEFRAKRREQLDPLEINS